MGPSDLSNLNGKTLLVFGGCGFIGSTFIRRVLAEAPECKVVNFDKLTYSGNVNNLKDVEHLITPYYGEKYDIASADAVEEVFAREAPHYVINFAAETHVDRSIHVGAKEFIDTNVTGVFNILEAIKKRLGWNHDQCVSKFVQVSTDEVYGQLPNPFDIPEDINETVRFTEEPYERAIPAREVARWQKFNRNSPFKPNVPYSATKAGGDVLCNAYHHTWDVPVIVTHCSNNYGPYQYPEKLVPYWVTCIMQGKKIPVYGDGMNIRDWIHVSDHVTALGAVLLRGEPGKDYLIGADNERTNLEMVQLIVNACAEIRGDFPGKINVEDHFEFVKDRPGHDRRYAIDHSAITEELGWMPAVTKEHFVAALKDTIEWYMNNKEWVEEVIERTGVANPQIDLWKGHNL